jgi:hypothetical protein
VEATDRQYSIPDFIAFER